MSEEKKKDEVQEEVVSVEESTTIERCLTFNAGGLILYISTKYVIEIINNHTITTLPLMPPYIKGIINLRGKPETDYTSKTCIIVLDIDSVPLGIIVDSVRQMIDIDLKDVKPIPLKRQQKMLDGMVTMEDGSVFMSVDCKALADAQA